MVVIPASSTTHIIGKGGKGLKQISDIAGAQVSAFEVATSLDECCKGGWEDGLNQNLAGGPKVNIL